MEKILKPTLIIGLSSYGENYIKAFENELVGSQYKNAIKFLSISDDGEVKVDKSSTSVSIKFDKEIMNKNAIRSNYENIFKQKEKIELIIERAITNLYSVELKNDISLRNFDITNIQIFIYAPLFDSVGSVCIIPIVDCLTNLKKNGKIPDSTEVYFWGILADLSLQSDESKKEKEFSRCFAALSEIDYEILDCENKPHSNFIINFIWLLTSKNEDQVSIGKIDDLIPSIISFSQKLIVDPFTDKSFAHLLDKELLSRKCHYSSFGSSILEFPFSETLDLLGKMSYIEVMSPFIEKINSSKYDRNEIAAFARNFISKLELNFTIEKLKVDINGQSIFQNIPFKRNLDYKKDLNEFYDECSQAFNEYENKTLNEIILKTNIKKDQLLSEYRNQLLQETSNLIDNSEKGLPFASAFLSYLSNQNSSFFKGEFLEIGDNLIEVEEKLKRFYKELLGLDTKEKEFLRKEQDLNTKERYYQRLNEDIDRIKNEIADKNLKDIVEHESEKTKSGIELNNATSKLEIIKKEIIGLKKELNELVQEINSLNLCIEDASRRRELKTKIIIGLNENSEKIKKQLTDCESEINVTKKSLNDLFEKRKKILSNLLYIFPPIVFLISTILFIYVTGYAPPVIIIAYLIWALYYYEKQVGREIRETKQTLQDKQNQKTGLLLNFQNNLTQIQYTNVDHLIHGYGYEFIKTIQDDTKAINNSIIKFIDNIKPSNIQTNTEIEQINLFQQTIAKNSVISREFCQHLIATKKNDIIRYFNSGRNKPLSYFWLLYDETRDFSLIQANIQMELKEKFNDLANNSVNDMIFRNDFIKEEYSPNMRLKKLFEFSKPFVSLKDQNNLYSINEILILEAYSKDGEELIEIFKDLSNKRIEFKSSDSPYRMTLTRLLIGFPLFRLYIMQICDNTMKQLGQSLEEMKLMYVDEKYTNYNIFPEYDQINEDPTENEPLKLFSLSKAFNIIEIKDKGILLKSTNKIIAKDSNSLISILKNEENELTMTINEQVKLVLKDKDAINKLKKINKNLFDKKEMLQIRQVIEEISDL